MKILFLGDIFGKPGREAVKRILPDLRQKEKFDVVIANAENLSHGKGASIQSIEEMQKAGIDFFTSGNHVWKQKKTVAKLDDKSFPLIRPANYPEGVPGRGWQIIQTSMMKKLLVINLIGRVFFRDSYDCPFRKVDKILEETKGENLNGIFVDFHAEATSEKRALGHYLAERVSAVVGTHTHIPTNDAEILNNHTAYITDVGMVGPYDSVIGVEKKIIIRTFLTQIPEAHDVAAGPMVFNGVIIDIDAKTQKALTIVPIIERIGEI
jgi:2',3'-cyclic-nucleotide 2'-phosphodiesterase